MNHHKIGRPRASRVAATAIFITGAVAVATVGAGPALSAPGGPGGPGGPAEPAECPLPAAPVTAGDPVTGKTVSSGTTPEAFEGEVIGVVDNAVAPDFDLIVVRLTSPEIDRVGGIWSGMSGSPVYDAAGDLIGAVAYGFSWSPSPIAGVTPAAEMQALLSAAPTDPEAAATLKAAATRDKVDLPDSIERKVVASGAATQAEVAGGLTRLPMSLAVSGNVDGKRLGATLDRMGLSRSKVYATGSATADSETYDIVSGGNLAASMSYGDVTFAGVGTATAVCDDEILAFGHPFNYTGESSLALHGATAVFVQEDPNWVPFKMANLGAPSGTVVQDRLAGLLSVPGDVSPAAEITSTVTSGARERDGTTFIAAPDWVADIGAWHLYYDQERIFDAHAEGSQTSAWTVEGQREDGTPFQYSRDDRFADPWDLVWSAPDDLYMQLYRLMNTDEDVTINKIVTTSDMSADYKKFTISRVQVRAGGEWRRLPRVLRVRPGTTKRFLVTLTSKQLPTRYARVQVTIPRRAVRWGSIEIRGGNSYGGWEDFWWEPTSGSSFDKTLKDIKSEPRNDEVVADLRVRRRGGGVLTRTDRVRKAAVVDGARWVQVSVRR
ncbi:MAG TPA: hypothetical protein VFZ64_02210 [Nocardioidaceae bacterium]